MIVAVILLAGLGAVGWSLAWRARERCLRYEGVLDALRGSCHATHTLVDALVAVHGIEAHR